MKFSSFTALCAAPLALASLSPKDVDMALNARGDSHSSNGNYNNNNNINQNGNSNQQQTVVEEIIIIWLNEGGGAPTSTIQATSSVGSATTSAATHQVTVGGSAGLVYSPNSIAAAIGDMVVFTFLSLNHTVTQSSFTTPCLALPNGTDSSFVPNVNNTIVPPPQMAMQVTVDTPLWFYCRQSGHCGKGMTFSINPSANKTQAMFEAAAIAQNGTGVASPIVTASGAGSVGTTAASIATTSVVSVASATTLASVASASASGIVSGTGSINSNGACDCSCLCGVAAFPVAAVQGANGFGGMSGSMPMAMLA